MAGLLLVAALSLPAIAQETRMVTVGGRAMNVQLAGLEHKGKRPLVIFEAGGGAGVQLASPVFGEIAKVAPVLAYDRAGLGGSEPDDQSPTPRHVAERLHRLLAELELSPPYVLVGHSWGGPLVRMFVATYPNEVAGVVYLDPTDLRTRQQDLEHLRAAGYTLEQAQDHLGRYNAQFDAYIGTLAPNIQAEFRVIQAIETSDSPDFERLTPPAVPVTVLLSGRFDPAQFAGRPCEPRACHRTWLEFRRKWIRPLLAASRQPTLLVDEESGHIIQRDNPTLVAAEIRKLLAPAAR
jgi:pimeloyl-ACP methyl ester carboxylesterase